MTIGELIASAQDKQIVNIDLVLPPDNTVAEGIGMTVWRLKHLLDTPIQYWKGSEETATLVQIVVSDLDLYEVGEGNE